MRGDVRWGCCSELEGLFSASTETVEGSRAPVWLLALVTLR